MRALVITLTVLSSLALAAPASAALNSYLRLTGQTQGAIEGGVTQAGREDSIMIIAFSHEVTAPRDAASGLPTGKRQHKPFSVTMAVDKSAPLLFNALANNENITEFRLEMWRPSRSGQEQQYFTIELENATIASINLDSGPEARDPHTVTVTFAYQKIIQTWEDGGITAEDDWESPVSMPLVPRRIIRRN